MLWDQASRLFYLCCWVPRVVPTLGTLILVAQYLVKAMAMTHPILGQLLAKTGTLGLLSGYKEEIVGNSTFVQGAGWLPSLPPLLLETQRRNHPAGNGGRQG